MARSSARAPHDVHLARDARLEHAGAAGGDVHGSPSEWRAFRRNAASRREFSSGRSPARARRPRAPASVVGARRQHDDAPRDEREACAWIRHPAQHVVERVARPRRRRQRAAGVGDVDRVVRRAPQHGALANRHHALAPGFATPQERAVGEHAPTTERPGTPRRAGRDARKIPSAMLRPPARSIASRSRAWRASSARWSRVARALACASRHHPPTHHHRACRDVPARDPRAGRVGGRTRGRRDIREVRRAPVRRGRPHDTQTAGCRGRGHSTTVVNRVVRGASLVLFLFGVRKIGQHQKSRLEGEISSRRALCLAEAPGFTRLFDRALRRAIPEQL